MFVSAWVPIQAHAASVKICLFIYFVCQDVGFIDNSTS
jgi:hypothetical protein